MTLLMRYRSKERQRNPGRRRVLGVGVSVVLGRVVKEELKREGLEKGVAAKTSPKT
jgi:hypothetical protein